MDTEVQPAPDLMRFRSPTAEDGRHVFQLVRDAGVLELNTAYTYVMMADMFADTCIIAEHGDKPVGCIVGFRPPRVPHGFFVWQIGVHPDARGKGLAIAMLNAVLNRPDNSDITELLATVSPDNTASERMFRAFARQRGAGFDPIGGYPRELFPGAHEAETLFRIAPL